MQKAYSVKDIQKKYLRAYESWTQEEDQQLMLLYNDGLTISDLVNRLQRQPGGIKARLKKLGLL